MRRCSKCCWIFAGLLLSAAAILAEDAYKIEAISGPPADAPKALQDALETQGNRLLDGKGAAVCEIWLSKAIPMQQASGSSSDILYGNLAVGTLVGVLRFPNGGSDFRGQTIKAGTFTMRYALIPQDGNHMGVSSYRDFLLLSPLAKDTDADQVLSFEELLKLSRQASGTNHPAIFSLNPVQDSQSFPALVHDDQGHWILQVKLQGKSASGGQAQSLPIALTLIGKAQA